MRHNIQYIFPIDVIKNVFLKCHRQSVGNHVLNNGPVAGSNSPQDFGPGAERVCEPEATMWSWWRGKPCGMLLASPSQSSLGEKVEAGGEEWWSSAEKYFTELNQIWDRPCAWTAKPQHFHPPHSLDLQWVVGKYYKALVLYVPCIWQDARLIYHFFSKYVFQKGEIIYLGILRNKASSGKIAYVFKLSFE